MCSPRYSTRPPKLTTGVRRWRLPLALRRVSRTRPRPCLVGCAPGSGDRPAQLFRLRVRLHLHLRIRLLGGGGGDGCGGRCRRRHRRRRLQPLLPSTRARASAARSPSTRSVSRTSSSHLRNAEMPLCFHRSQPESGATTWGWRIARHSPFARAGMAHRAFVLGTIARPSARHVQQPACYATQLI